MSEEATIFVGWVYANHGKTPEDYASELVKLIENERAKERERCCRLVYGHASSDTVAERTVRAIRKSQG